MPRKPTFTWASIEESAKLVAGGSRHRRGGGRFLLLLHHFRHNYCRLRVTEDRGAQAANTAALLQGRTRVSYWQRGGWNPRLCRYYSVYESRRMSREDHHGPVVFGEKEMNMRGGAVACEWKQRVCVYARAFQLWGWALQQSSRCLLIAPAMKTASWFNDEAYRETCERIRILAVRI